jgi:putative ABC transport system substrate-binding protein
MRLKSRLCTGALLCAAVASAGGAAERVYKIGVITYAGDPGNAGPRQTAGGNGPKSLAELLADRGYVVGKNLEIQYRAGGRNMERTREFARELVAWKPDLIVGQMTNADIAVKEAVAGTDIPVIVWSTDPQEAGLIKTFTHTGGNINGFAYEPWIEVLQMRILKLVQPDLKLVGHLYNHTYAPAPSTLRRLREAGKLMNVEVKVYEALKTEDFEKSFAAMKADGVTAVAVGPHELFNTNGPALGALSLKYKFPMVGCCQVSLARGGGLAAYSPPNGWPAMAERIDLILQGKAKPSEMPVVRNIASPLTLNLKTAAALGLKIPDSLIDEATTLIQ